MQALYALEHQKREQQLDIYNNLAENAIRPLAIGRKAFGPAIRVVHWFPQGIAFEDKCATPVVCPYKISRSRAT
jgi:hypothetical protein